MALDHALAACLDDGTGVLRFYRWARPTLSFGRNEGVRGRYGMRPGGLEVDFVRRPTGGRAVLHWRELTYAVVAPLDAWSGLRAAYRAIHEALAGALQGLAPVAVAEARSAGGVASVLGPDAGPCFRAPAPGELVAEGRKLVGSAQARLEGSLLQHGSILVEDDQALVEDLMALAGNSDGAPGGGRWAAGERPATLREWAGDVSIDELVDLVAKSLRETFGGTWELGSYRPTERRLAERFEEERYARDSWTWRR